MSDKETKMRYWNPETEACYIQMQVDRMADEVKAGLVEIEEDYWMELIRQNASEGKLIQNNPETNTPIAVDPPEPTAEEKAQVQIRTAKEYLSSTDYAVVKCLECGLSIEENYPGLMAKRQEMRDLVNELEATLAGVNT